MSRRSLLAAVLCVSASVVGAPDLGLGLLGPDAAAARDTYSRKRVNGRWITGTFLYRQRSPVPQQRVAEADGAVVDAGRVPAAAEEPAATGSLGDYAILLQRGLIDRQSSFFDRTPAFFTPTRAIRSVVIDYQSGIKTTFYVDGGVSEQPLVGEPTLAGSLQSWPFAAPR
jgi:hypothetical protein